MSLNNAFGEQPKAHNELVRDFLKADVLGGLLIALDDEPLSTPELLRQLLVRRR